MFLVPGHENAPLVIANIHNVNERFLLVDVGKGLIVQHLEQDFVLSAFNVQFENDVIILRESVYDPLREVNDRNSLPIRQFSETTCNNNTDIRKYIITRISMT